MVGEPVLYRAVGVSVIRLPYGEIVHRVDGQRGDTGGGSGVGQAGVGDEGHDGASGGVGGGDGEIGGDGLREDCGRGVDVAGRRGCLREDEQGSEPVW